MKQQTLDIIGRHHTVDDTIQSFKLARELGFDNINMDLIMGLPEESLDDVRHTMELVKELAPDNVTIHSLAVKRAARLTIFKDRYRDMQMVNTQEHMDLCAAYCKQMGLEHTTSTGRRAWQATWKTLAMRQRARPAYTIY